MWTHLKLAWEATVNNSLINRLIIVVSEKFRSHFAGCESHFLVFVLPFANPFPERRDPDATQIKGSLYNWIFSPLKEIPLGNKPRIVMTKSGWDGQQIEREPVRSHWVTSPRNRRAVAAWRMCLSDWETHTRGTHTLPFIKKYAPLLLRQQTSVISLNLTGPPSAPLNERHPSLLGGHGKCFSATCDSPIHIC